MSATECAKMIRQDLKANFPNIKFLVKSHKYAGGDSVRVSYENGPRQKQVEELLSKYEYGHFDGMTDMYEYSNSRDDIPQTRFLFVNRDITENVYETYWNITKDYFSWYEGLENMDSQFKSYLRGWTPRQEAQSYLRGIDLTNGLTKQQIDDNINC